MSRVYFDSNLFLYAFEGHEEFSPVVATIWKRMRARGDVLLASALTFGEVMVRPLASGNDVLARRYERAFASARVEIVPFDLAGARRFAEIRSDNAIRPADAIHLACAASARCDLFITNDDRLSRKYVPGIQFIVPLSRVPF